MDTRVRGFIHTGPNDVDAWVASSFMTARKTATDSASASMRLSVPASESPKAALKRPKVTKVQRAPAASSVGLGTAADSAPPSLFFSES